MADKRESIELDHDELMSYGKVGPNDPDFVYAEPKKKPSDTISLKLDVDVSEAITGLKAIQREAKAATKALAELREEQRDLSIEGVAQVLEKFLESPKVDTLKLKDALGILTPTERHRLIHEDVREPQNAENAGGER